MATTPKPEMLGSGSAAGAGKALGGRKSQLDRLEEAATSVMPEDEGPMYGDGAYGMRKVRGAKRKAARRSGNNWPW
jgi:hypothetical protein